MNAAQMQPQYAMPMQNVNVQSAQFQPFNAGVSPLMQEENIDLVLDVPLEVTVELGRTNKSIKEILDPTMKQYDAQIVMRDIND